MSTHRHHLSAGKRRVVIAALAATLMIGGAGTAAAAYSSGSDSSGSSSPAPSVKGGLEPVELAPYEPLNVTDDTQLGMLPEGKQNYVLAPREQFEQRVEDAKSRPGNGLAPDSLSLRTHADAGDVQLVAGAWRHGEIPSQIIVSREGEDFGYAAQIVHLPGESEWGTYYLDTTELPDLDGFTVTAYDQDNNAFHEREYTPQPSDS